MRPSILYILVGLNFAVAINVLAEAFLFSVYYIPLLILLAATGVFVIISSKADFDLLDEQSGMWAQIAAGATLGVAYDLIFFRVIIWLDLVKLFVAFLVFAITGFVVRMKKPTVMTATGDGVQLELASSSTKKTTKTRTSGTVSRKKTSSKSRSPTKKKRS